MHKQTDSWFIDRWTDHTQTDNWLIDSYKYTDLYTDMTDLLTNTYMDITDYNYRFLICINYVYTVPLR